MTAAPPQRKHSVLATAAIPERRLWAALSLAAGTLAATAILVGNPFAENRLFPSAWATPAAPTAPVPPRLPSHALVVALPLPKPVAVRVAANASAPIVDAPATGSVTVMPSAPLAPQAIAAKRGPVIIEVLPGKPIIPPFTPKQPAGAPPTLRPALPLDTELTGTWALAAPHRAAAEAKPGITRASAERDG